MATLALIVAVAALGWSWRLHCRVRELEAHEEERADEHFRRTSLLFD